jgi:hypothetical protein
MVTGSLGYFRLGYKLDYFLLIPQFETDPIVIPNVPYILQQEVRLAGYLGAKKV